MSSQLRSARTRHPDDHPRRAFPIETYVELATPAMLKVEGIERLGELT
jgi:hypothetical protein